MGGCRQVKKSKEYILVLAVFILLTAVFTWPLAAHPGSGVLMDGIDPLLNTWILAHDAGSLPSFSGFFQGNMMYPARDVITYSEHQFSLALAAAPVYWATGNPVLAYNLLMFFGFVFSAFGMYLLLRYLTGNRWAGLAAGTFFAFVPYKFSQLGHVQICFSAFLPFTLLYLHKFLDEGRTRHLAAFGVFFLAQSLASWHYLVYASMAVLLVIAGKAFLDWRRTGWPKLVKLAAVGLVCALLVLPFALPYARTFRRFDDFQRTLEETRMYNARMGDYFNVMPQNVLYGGGGPGSSIQDDLRERILCPGLCIIFLAAMGLALRRRDYRGWEEERADEVDEGDGPSGEEAALPEDAGTRSGWPVLAPYLALALVSFLLAFGPEIGGMTNYFYTIPFNAGLLKFSRVPARFFIPFSLGLAVLGGIGLDRLIHSVKRGRIARLDTRNLVGAAICAFLLLEMLIYGIPYPRVAAADAGPQAYRWLAEQGDVRVISLPTEAMGPVHVYDRDLAVNPEDSMEFFSREVYLIYLSTAHWKDIVNGYSGYFPFSYRRAITEMQGFPAARPLGLLEGLGVDYVIWHRDWVPEERREYVESQFASLAGRLELVEDFGEQQVWRIARAGERAGPDQIDTRLACPSMLPAGRQWHLGIYVANRSDSPFVSTDEEFHTLRLRWSGEGGRSFEQEARLHTPFFVDRGETWTVAVDVPDTPPPGAWRLEARIEGGELDGREFESRVEVREDLPDSSSPGVFPDGLDAQLQDLELLDGLALEQEDGLFSTRLVVTNTGEAQWLADSEDRSKHGVVRLAMRFQQGYEIVWEEQRFTLPCDVSPGQTVVMPVLLRVPREPGGYHLYVGMTVEGYGWFGQVAEVDLYVGEVEVAPGAEAPAP